MDAKKRTKKATKKAAKTVTNGRTKTGRARNAAGKKAWEIKQAAGIRQALDRREKALVDRDVELAEKEAAHNARESSMEKVAKGLSADLERTKKELASTQTQISNQIKHAAIEHYTKTRGHNAELPHWSRLDDDDQIEWQKFVLKLEGLKKQRLEIIQRNTFKYGQHLMKLDAGELEDEPALGGGRAYDV